MVALVAEMARVLVRGLQHASRRIDLPADHGLSRFFKTCGDVPAMMSGQGGCLVNERVILTGLMVASVALAPELPNSASGAARKDGTMIATGAFDVTATPQPEDDTAGGPFGRLFLDKQF